MALARGWMLLAAAGAAAAVCTPVLAQDSVSSAFGVPGDALDAYRTASPSDQVARYVVDLTPITSSWGGRFAIGPVSKASKANSVANFNHLIGAQAASGSFVVGPFYPAGYAVWSAAGRGVNSQRNTAPDETIDTTTYFGERFGVAFMEFGDGPDGAFGTGDDENNVIANIIGFRYRDPNRLFVTRVAAAANKASNTTGDTATASFGLGGIDAAGHVHLLADGYGMQASGRLLTRRLYRIDAAARDPSLVNQILSSGAGDATATDLVLDTSTYLTTPTIIDSDVASRPVMIGTDFASRLYFEQSPNTIANTTAYLPAGSPRGTVRFVAQTGSIFNNGTNDAGIGATLVRTDVGTKTRGVAVFGVNTDGSVDAASLYALPATVGQITDPTDGFDPAVAMAPLGDNEFTGYESQASFRGGNGQVAMTVLADGDLLVAAPVRGPDGSGLVGENGYIVTARISSPSGAVSWRVAAHTGPAGTGKAIRGDYGADGIPNTSDAGEGDGVLDATPIGRLATASETPPAIAGPSLSAAAMDRAGNLYFLATVALNSATGTDHTTALIRADYDPAAGSYTLELLVRLGDVIHGADSQTDYQVQYLGVADCDSIDSGAIFSSNIVEDRIDGADTAGAPVGSPFTLGALVFRAKIVYDRDGNGQFDDPSAAGGAGADQAYNVAMVLMPRVEPGDFNRNGTIDVFDLLDFLSAWFQSNADYNTDGTTDVFDLLDFLSDWFG